MKCPPGHKAVKKAVDTTFLQKGEWECVPITGSKKKKKKKRGYKQNKVGPMMGE